MTAGAASAASGTEPRDQARVLELLRKYGWNALSFQTLTPGLEYFFDGDGVVAYADTGRAWVAAGAPIADPTDLPRIAAEFVAAAQRAGRRVCFFGVEQRFLEAIPSRALLVGEQPTWKPAQWPEVIQGHRTLRHQLRRAAAKGVTVRPVSESAVPSFLPQLNALTERWLVTRPLAPLSFLVTIQAASFASHRRAWAAHQDGQLVAWLTATPLYARKGWLLEHLLRDPDAPNGTAELLIDAAMSAAREEGLEYVTLGMVPLAGAVPLWLRATRKMASPLYRFEGLRSFKAKLKPSHWDGIWLAVPKKKSVLASLWDVLAAFAGGHPLRFAWATLRRGPSWVLHGHVR